MAGRREVVRANSLRTVRAARAVQGGKQDKDSKWGQLFRRETPEDAALLTAVSPCRPWVHIILSVAIFEMACGNFCTGSLFHEEVTIVVPLFPLNIFISSRRHS